MIGVTGKNVVVSGIIAGESRNTAEERLRDAGAYVHGTVTGKVDLLIIGDNVGQTKKVRDAAAKGVTVVPWSQIDWTGAGDGTVDAAPAVTAPKAARARQIAPMLAEKADLPTGDDWTFEIKWDGYRCVATVKDGAVAMSSRSAKTDWTVRFPHIAQELTTLPDCVIDGEIVVLSKAGGAFQALAGGTGNGASFVVFDAIEYGGHDLRAATLADRRTTLNTILSFASGAHVTASPVFDDGPLLLSYCIDNGLEGLIAKRSSSRYHDGARSADWIKVKVRPGQEAVVVGFTKGEGRRADTFGALLLGMYVGDTLTFVGKVGTGWDDVEHAQLFGKLQALKPGTAPAGTPRKHEKDATWVEPEMVVEVEFQRWTADGVMWHPSYKGERLDKPVSAVRKEA